MKRFSLNQLIHFTFTIAIFVLFCVSITRFTNYLIYDEFDTYNIISLWTLTIASYVASFVYSFRHMCSIYVGMYDTSSHS